jgi:hypothetical protein
LSSSLIRLSSPRIKPPQQGQPRRDRTAIHVSALKLQRRSVRHTWSLSGFPAGHLHRLGGCEASISREELLTSPIGIILAVLSLPYH